MTLEELLMKIRRDLEAANVATAALDARILVRQGGNFSDADLIAGGSTPLSSEVIEKTLKYLSRRLEGEPVSRILGEREFWGLSFKVTPATLDPRADTETLVEAALKRAREVSAASFQTSAPPSPTSSSLSQTSPSSSRTPPPSSRTNVRDPRPLSSAADSLPSRARNDGRGLRMLDLGTGTGCIPIALLTELPHATAVAVDISEDALIVSRENAARHGVESRIEFRCGSWFDPVAAGEVFDIITSNPPYIRESSIESLSKEVRNHDPIQALSGGADGLDAYKTILTEMKNHLDCGGFALFEIGEGQETDLARLIEDSNMTRRESYVDLGGILRVVEITHGEK